MGLCTPQRQGCGSHPCSLHQCPAKWPRVQGRECTLPEGQGALHVASSGMRKVGPSPTAQPRQSPARAGRLCRLDLASSPGRLLLGTGVPCATLKTHRGICAVAGSAGLPGLTAALVPLCFPSNSLPAHGSPHPREHGAQRPHLLGPRF